VPELKPGSRWRSAVSEVEIVVVKAVAGEVDLWCGDAPVLPQGTDAPGAGDSEPGGTTQLGKRYTDAADTLEVLCTRGGAGELSLAGDPLVLKGAKPLPSSD
jgi:hypothetical protein